VDRSGARVLDLRAVPFPVAPELPKNVLARRTTLPLRPRAVTLEGSFVRLVPLELERDVERLFAVSNGREARLGERTVEAYDPDERIWRYMSAGPFRSPEELASFLRPQVEASNGLCLAVRDRATDEPVGAANFMANFPEHLKIELGNIWYGPLVQRTNANLEATFLMLGHAFDLGYRRVEWKCDALNERSRRSALRMGFQFEGIQRNHYIVKGRSRDTAWFRMLDEDWPEARAAIRKLL
jgi:RimJ/RimL family protein N-acetyltransferase